MMEFNCLSDAYSSVKFSRLAIQNAENQLNIIVDTGASIPVWTDTSEMLQHYYKDAIKLDIIAELSGFGGDGEDADVWLIPTFVLSDGKEKVTYNDLLVAVSPTDENISFIISFNMLTSVKLTYAKSSVVDKPKVTMEFSKNSLSVVPSYMYSSDSGKEALGRISVYSQTPMKTERTIFSLTEDCELCKEIQELNYLPNATFFINLLGSYHTTLTNDDIINKVKERMGVKV